MNIYGVKATPVNRIDKQDVVICSQMDPLPNLNHQSKISDSRRATSLKARETSPTPLNTSTNCRSLAELWAICTWGRT